MSDGTIIPFYKEAITDSEKLFFLALWFERMYPGNQNHEVNDDLRRIAASLSIGTRATGPWCPFSEAPKDGVLLVRFDFDAVWYDIVDIGELRKMQFGKSLEFVEKTATHFALINEVPE